MILTDSYIGNKINPIKNVSIKYKSMTHTINSFVEREQLLDKSLWDIFVKQFSSKADGADGGWRGEYWGKMMRGACLTYSYTKNPKLYSMLKYAIIELLKTQNSDGSIKTYEKDLEFRGWDLWCRKYVMLGLLYFIDICKSNKLKARILRAVCRHADYILKYVGEDKKKITDCSSTFEGMNSCSILEPFVKLYKATGDLKYLDFSRYIISTGFVGTENIIELAYAKEKYPYDFKYPKAYEMMSCFQGLLEYYTVTKEQKYLVAVMNLFDMIAETELTEIGALGCKYEFFNNSIVYQTETTDKPMLETCVTVTWINCCYQLLRFTGNSKYADYIEKSYLNAMIGTVNLEKNVILTKWLNPGRTYLDSKGMFYPFDSYSPMIDERRGIDIGGKRIIRDDGAFYGCCYCIGSMGTAIPAIYGIMQDADGLVINTFEKATFKLLSPSGKKMTIVSSGDLLNGDGKIKFRFLMKEKENLKIKIRIPEWSEKTSVKVNGANVDGVKRGEYLFVNGEYENGSFIEVKLDVRLKVIKVNDKKLIKKGPFVLARDQRYDDGFYDALLVKPSRTGRIRAKKIKTGLFHCQAEFEFKDKNGKTFKMCDYASAGNTWDKEDNAKLSVWL
jgi:DUF1680 family protein